MQWGVRSSSQIVKTHGGCMRDVAKRIDERCDLFSGFSALSVEEAIDAATKVTIPR
jgi:hypothetical protein